MTDNELLLAISDIVDKNSKTLEKRLTEKIDEVDTRLSAKLDEVDSRLSTEVHNILLRMENNIEPRLDNIEACYTSTYNRYKDGVEKIENLEMNMDVVKSVVREHSKKLNAISA